MALFTKTLTIKDLLNLDDGRIDRSKNLTVKYVGTENVLIPMRFIDKVLKIITGKVKLLYTKLVRYEVKSDSGSVYTVFIKVSPGFTIDQFYKQRVEVFCSCADFMYRAAYNLNNTNNLVKIKATTEHLGQALKIKPTKVSTTPICKHVYAVIQQFKKDYNKLNLIYN